MERHNGSKKKGWPQKGCEEGRTQSRKEGRQKKGNEKEGHPQAPITTLQKKKAGFEPAFFFSSPRITRARELDYSIDQRRIFYSILLRRHREITFRLEITIRVRFDHVNLFG